MRHSSGFVSPGGADCSTEKGQSVQDGGSRIHKLTLVASFSLAVTGLVAKAETLFGRTDKQEIVTFLSTNPVMLTSPVGINGLKVSDRLVAIDCRLANGQLFGLGQMNRL